jgi:hypothetical protein
MEQGDRELEPTRAQNLIQPEISMSLEADSFLESLESTACQHFQSSLLGTEAEE